MCSETISESITITIIIIMIKKIGIRYENWKVCYNTKTFMNLFKKKYTW